MMSTMTYAAWALAAGAWIPLMAILNAGLARAAGGTIQATILLFATGLAASLLLAALTTAPMPSLRMLAGAAPRPVTIMRAVGLLIMVIGVVIAQAGDRLWAGMR